jgi:hypothetical protein
MQYGKTTRMPALCALIALCAAGVMFVSSAKAGPDLSTPKKAALAFTKGIESGDMDSVKAASVGTDEDYKALKSLSDMLGSLRKMQAALVKKYGNDAKAIPDLSTVMSKQINLSEEKVDGDSATLVVKEKPDDKHPPTLKKTGNEWKMDLKSMTSDPEFAKMKDKAPQAIDLLDGFTKDIESGKYPTFGEAAQALGQTMSKLGT